jgi:5-methylcytosine-specific restriction endonuclease McrA
LDHVVPLGRGGDHVESNTQLLCRACNHDKGDAIETVELLERLCANRANGINGLGGRRVNLYSLRPDIGRAHFSP